MIKKISDIKYLQNILVKHLTEVKSIKDKTYFSQQEYKSYISSFIPSLFESFNKIINTNRQNNNKFLYYSLDVYKLTLLSSNKIIIIYNFQTSKLYVEN